MTAVGSLACPTCSAPLTRVPRARSKCKACNNWIYPAFKSVFHSTLLTEGQRTVTRALDFLQGQSPANAAVVSEFLPRLRAARDADALGVVTRELFVALEPKDDVALAEVHWHKCAWFLACLGQEFRWALRRSAEALLDRRMLEAVLSGSAGGSTPTEQDVFLSVCFQKEACDACRSTGGYESGSTAAGARRFTVAEARAQGVLPHSGCQSSVKGMRGFCRCRYKAAL
jgi:hypothetical protein